LRLRKGKNGEALTPKNLFTGLTPFQSRLLERVACLEGQQEGDNAGTDRQSG
jgi:hypothetical protein